MLERITGFDDVSESYAPDVAITSVESNREEMGRKRIRMGLFDGGFGYRPKIRDFGRCAPDIACTAGYAKINWACSARRSSITFPAGWKYGIVWNVQRQ